MKNASTAMQVARSPASEANRSFEVLNTFAFLRAARAHSKRARPESIAEATKMGAMMAEYQPSFAICRPKIQAVTECTKMAQGRAKREMMDTARSLPFFMFTRYRILMTR